MVNYTEEDWQVDIIARDALDYFTLTSKIASILYPELLYAAEREKKLMQIPEMQRLRSICIERYKKDSKLLEEWRKKDFKMTDIKTKELPTVEAAPVKIGAPIPAFEGNVFAGSDKEIVQVDEDFKEAPKLPL